MLRVNGKINFANQLRGIAALCVVGNHFLGVYWRGRDVVAQATHSLVQTGQEPDSAMLAASYWHNSGPFGVALFFLISGFVIPFSLKHHSRGSFLAARILRIYPVYIAALLLDLVILAASAAYWRQPLHLAPRQVLLNALLINNLGGAASLDLVNWSLAIELKFYLIAAIILGPIKKCQIIPILTLSTLLALFSILLKTNIIHTVSSVDSFMRALSFDLSYVIFMMIGVLFKFHFDQSISPKVLVPSIAYLGMLFALAMYCQVGSIELLFHIFVNYLYALVVFTALYLLRDLSRPVAWLDRMADISFPLYVIHSILGYSILKILIMGAGIHFYPALMVAVFAVMVVAWGLHRSLEMPSITWGRALELPRNETALV